MNKEYEQLTFPQTISSMSETKPKRHLNSSPKPNLNRIKSFMLGATEQTLVDFQPKYETNSSIPDESDPKTFPDQERLLLQDEVLADLVNHYEVSLNDHQNTPSARATKRAKLESYRQFSHNLPERQITLAELSPTQRQDFDQLTQHYFNADQLERKEIRRQLRGLIDQAYQLQIQGNPDESNHY